MAFETLAGQSSADVASYGLTPAADGDPLPASLLNENWQDLQADALYSLLAGVLEGGVCTASGLVVTVPSDTIYFARGLWTAHGVAQTTSVPDAATTYVWGCSDGQLRQTATTTPPTSFTARTACLLCVAVASGGVAVVNLAVQQRARYADGTNRMVFEPGAWAPTPYEIPVAAVAEIAALHQMVVKDDFTVYGALNAFGNLWVEV